MFQDIQVYHYYRDLIQFYSKGDPKLMLKCINPKEADLLDYASGIHIRFRLAGVSEIARAVCCCLFFLKNRVFPCSPYLGLDIISSWITVFFSGEVSS